MQTKKTLEVGIVIPQKRHTELTQALVLQIRTLYPDICIIVVNDDEEPVLIEEAHVIRNRGTGVTAAWNTGVRYVRDEVDWVIVLNNDVTVNGPFVKELCKGKGIVGTKFRVEGAVSPPRKVLEGWCLAFPIKMWKLKAVRNFSEAMKLYFSDADFQLRAVRAGCTLTEVSVPLVHMGHRTAHDSEIVPDRTEQWQHDCRVFKKRWNGRPDDLKKRPPRRKKAKPLKSQL